MIDLKQNIQYVKGFNNCTSLKSVVVPKNADISGSKFGFDSEATYKPTAIYDKEKRRWLLWYNGRLVNREYIGMAICNEFEFWKN